MITKEQLKKQHDEILASIRTIDRELDDIWEAARVADFDKVCRLSDHIRYFGPQSLGDTETRLRHLLEDLETVLEENEKTKDLPRLLDFQMAFDQIQATVKRWDERLYPEDYPNE